MSAAALGLGEDGRGEVDMIELSQGDGALVGVFFFFLQGISFPFLSLAGLVPLAFPDVVRVNMTGPTTTCIR
jgi:hypothetical protein